MGMARVKRNCYNIIMIQPVLKRGESLLYETSQEITDFAEAEEVVVDLWDTLRAIQKLYNFTRGSGIAAPQIGKLLRANVVEFNDQSYTLINPRIVAHSEDQVPMREGCLSFFDYRGMVLRYEEVTVEATDREGEVFTIEASGDFASLLQHEIDHLDGILYDSKLAPDSELMPQESMPRIP